MWAATSCSVPCAPNETVPANPVPAVDNGILNYPLLGFALKHQSA